MLRALWALFKIGIVVGIVVWIADRPGTITIDWMAYKFTLHVGFFLLIMVLLFVVGVVIFSVIKSMLDLPRNLSRYKELANKDKGLKALTLGLAAVAAGDGKAASYQAQRARLFLRKEEALPTLLEAQAARLMGHEMEAAQGFATLLDHKDAGFLGIRGLLHSALESGDDAGALELGYRALENHPKQVWILRVVYDLEIHQGHWERARKILYRLEKADGLSSEKANSDRVALLLAEAAQAKEQGAEEYYFRCLNKAYKTSPHFVPTTVRMARMYLDRGKKKAAASIIEKAWSAAPHPSLMALWDESCPQAKENDTMERVRWFEKLLSFNPQSVEGLQALACVMMQEGLWSEARKNLQKAENIRPNVNLYTLWARLEERATHDDVAVAKWLDMAEAAPRERVWICSETGRVYGEWVPISDQGLFNTIIWDFPEGRDHDSSTLISRARASRLLLEAH